ncbi:MAG TPA: tetratricopeptide repeat protein, partial [Flavisolibacter sp.]
MLRLFLPLLLLISIIHTSCSRRSKTEKEEVAFWNQRVIDSTYAFLFRNKNKEAALAFYDSLQEKAGSTTPYTRASRAGVVANYHYFLTEDNEATARSVDAALAFINTPELQQAYPRTYVNYLLFGGQIAYRLLQYSKANEYYFRAKKVADKALDPCERTAFNYSIAMVLYRQQNYKQSLNYFKTAYALQSTCAAQTTAVVLQQQEIQSNIGLCFLQLRGYDSALVHFDKALEIANQYRDSLGPITLDKIQGVVTGNKAKAYLELNRLDTAEALSLASIALNTRPGFERAHAQRVQLQLAEVYNRKGQFSRMIRVLKNLRADLDTLPNATVEVDWRKFMSTYHEQMSSPQDALSYFTSYIRLRDSLSGQQSLLTAADVNRQLRDKEQLHQITLLKKDNQLSHTVLWVTILVGVMAFAIILLIYQNYRR